MEEKNNALKNVGFGVAYAPAAALDLVSETLLTGGKLASGIVKVVDGVVSLPAKFLYGMGKEIGGPVGGVLTLAGGILAIPSAVLKVANVGLGLGLSLACTLSTVIAMPIKQLAYKIKGINYLEERQEFNEAYSEAREEASEAGVRFNRYKFIKMYIASNGKMEELYDKTMEAIEMFSEDNEDQYETRVKSIVKQKVQEMEQAGKKDQISDEDVQIAEKILLELPKLVRYALEECEDIEKIKKGKKIDIVNFVKKYLNQYAQEAQLTEKEASYLKEVLDQNDKTMKSIINATFIAYLSDEMGLDIEDLFDTDME